MIADLSLPDEIASEAADLRQAYPKGATMHDLAGWFGQPVSRVEAAIASMRERGDDVSFLRVEPEKNPAAVAMGQRGGRARAEKVDAERRAEIAAKAAAARWEGKTERGPYRKREPDEETPRELRAKLIAAIPRLAVKYPDGMIFEQIVWELGPWEARIRAVLATAMTEGWCDRIRERTESQARRQTYLFEGMMKRAPQLTERQADVYNWLKAHAKGDEVTAKLNQICRDLNVADGTVFGHLYAIEKKEYIERLTGYNERVNGVRISPKFRLLEIAAPTLVKLKKPPTKPIVAEPGPKATRAVEGFPPKRGPSKLLTELQAHRQRLEDELARVEAIISNYFAA